MSNLSADQLRVGKAPSVTELVAETRIDTSHAPASAAALEDAVDAQKTGINDGNELTPGEEVADESPDPEAISQQVEVQAAQLGEHLRCRQQEIDHREAELNAWAARLERDTRAAQLWYGERVAELEERGSAGETVVMDDESLRRIAEALAEREQRLAESESILEAERSALERFREQLAADRRRQDDDAQAQRERLTAEEIRTAAEIEKKRREVEQKNEQADQSYAALEQFRAELGRMHRETLEIRLATEELWGELSGAAPPAALTRSLGRIRSRLAEHYRTANLELHEKKQELEQLRSQLSEQYEKLVRQKRNFDAWVAECRDEVEQQAARLMARGDELDRREADMDEFKRRSHAEKLELQQEIRRLRSKLLGKMEVELPA